MVIGESQILTQLRQAYFQAQEIGTTGAFMENLMDRAIRVGKRSRSETRIGEGNVSVASVALGLAGRVFDDLVPKSILLIGAGKDRPYGCASFGVFGRARCPNRQPDIGKS